ncbi:hypothetical protein DND62_31880, partial [Pseudomonas syringae pv. pisi]
MLLLIRVNWKQAVIVIFSFSIISVILFGTMGLSSDGVQWIDTLHYISIFALGAIVAKYYVQLTQYLKQCKRRTKG